MEEREPGTFLRKVTYKEDLRLIPRLSHAAPSTLVVGREYTIGELVQASVRDNDRVATSLLLASTDMATLRDKIRQFGVPEACIDTTTDRLGARDYSLFWKGIVHGSALNIPH